MCFLVVASTATESKPALPLKPRINRFFFVAVSRSYVSLFRLQLDQSELSGAASSDYRDSVVAACAAHFPQVLQCKQLPYGVQCKQLVSPMASSVNSSFPPMVIHYLSRRWQQECNLNLGDRCLQISATLSEPFVAGSACPAHFLTFSQSFGPLIIILCLAMSWEALWSQGDAQARRSSPDLLALSVSNCAHVELKRVLRHYAGPKRRLLSAQTWLQAIMEQVYLTTESDTASYSTAARVLI